MSSLPPVVLVHSSGLSGRQWSRWALPGRRRVTPDLWGCGEKGPWPGPWPFPLRADLDDLVALLAEHGPADVVGHSYGGALALFAAAARPDLVRSVVAYEPPIVGVLGGFDPALFPAGSFDPATEGSEAWLEAFVDWWNGPGAWRGLGRSARGSFLRAARELWGSANGLMTDGRPLEAYASLPPTLLLVGGSPPAPIARALDRLATLPQVTLERLPGLGHMGPFLEPERVEARAVAFLASAALRG